MIRQIAETGKTVPLCDVIRRLVENGAFDKSRAGGRQSHERSPSCARTPQPDGDYIGK